MATILGISASARIWGNCETSVKQVLTAAGEAGAETRFARLTDRNLEPCRGCFRCLSKEGTCPIDDDLYALLGEIRSSDALVFASPVYFMSPPGALMGFLDRLLTVRSDMDAGGSLGPAVAITVMGNRRWRGVAEPLLNLTVSILGFEVVESLSLVAEGPGEVIASPDAAGRLVELGRALASGVGLAASERLKVCPVCRSDFFRLEPPAVVCPVCGLEGDLDAYVAAGRFVRTGGELRWGQEWLARHIDSWIRPSLQRYRKGRKEILANLRGLKERYKDRDGGGETDV
jgi:multimeric flavodoxin WrbA